MQRGSCPEEENALLGSLAVLLHLFIEVPAGSAGGAYYTELLLELIEGFLLGDLVWRVHRKGRRKHKAAQPPTGASRGGAVKSNPQSLATPTLTDHS